MSLNLIVFMFFNQEIPMCWQEKRQWKSFDEEISLSVFFGIEEKIISDSSTNVFPERAQKKILIVRRPRERLSDARNIIGYGAWNIPCIMQPLSRLNWSFFLLWKVGGNSVSISRIVLEKNTPCLLEHV